MRKLPGLMMLAAAAVVALGACSPSNEQPSDLPPGVEVTRSATEQAHESSPAPTSSTPEQQGSSQQQGPECAIDDIEVTGQPGQQPKITIPQGCAPPGELLRKDLRQGTGAEVSLNSALQVNYQLVTWSDGKVVDGSYRRGQPLPIDNLGQAGLIQGWKEGLVGMKQGGRRLLVIPPELGYGAQGKPPVKPDETLVFVIDAVSVTS